MDHHTVADILGILRHPVQLLADISRRPQPADIRHRCDHSHVPRESQVSSFAGQNSRSARDLAADLRGEHRPRQERVSGKRENEPLYSPNAPDRKNRRIVAS